MESLRLTAEDIQDLEVISASVQDAVLKAENLKFDARRRRFALELNRYRWEQKEARSRVRSLLAIDGVLSVKSRAISKADPDLVLSLLSLEFEAAAEPPGGVLRLHFAGDGELALSVEAIDVTLLDSDYEWATRKIPNHEKRRR